MPTVGGIRVGGSGKAYPGKLTLFVTMTCTIATIQGFILGYDIRKSGGMTVFSSSLYLAALLSSIVASKIMQKLGREFSMFLDGILFCFNTIINAGTQNILMLILGHILLGFSIGFTNQAQHPTGDDMNSSFYEAMRTEIRHAMKEIRIEFGQAKGNPKPTVLVTDNCSLSKSSE